MSSQDRKLVPSFEVNEEWVSALPFENRPSSITHLPLECVVYVPSTQGDRTIDAAEFAAGATRPRTSWCRCSAAAGSPWPPGGTEAGWRDHL